MAEPDPPPVLCHLSGNWARVAIDAYTRYTERCPDRTLMQFSAPGLPVYSSSPTGDVGVILAWGCADDVVGLVQT